MTAGIQSVALMRYLKKKSDVYFGKSLELRDEIRGWLNYIPQTFPHYTRHTIEHSEEIIVQLSRLLFRDAHGNEPTIDLSGVEAYILVAAAYLHDAGMVASDSEKEQILKEDGWRRWTSGDGDATERWRNIQEFRTGHEPANEDIRNFIADLETRHLIAEYVRRVHHERSGDVIRDHQAALGRFAFDDPELQTAITEICVAHGLLRNRLDDRIRFPLLRQIRGEDVNLRLLAILLRLGDLLDLHSSRACPLLLNAACPLSPESYAHWTQYKRITHRAFSPDVIEIRAECETAEEHRVLRDWCQWIVDEVQAAPQLLAGAPRHSEWTPPSARMSGDNPTICIEPAPGATYRPRDWRFELDETEVFKRLISDVYEHPWAFLRELIQNALDAMRCQMYEDLKADKRDMPLSPTKVPEDIRKSYRLKIVAREEKVRNEHTDQEEIRQVVIVEDCGIGMDEEVITQHFLQVGRSYYTSENFRRRYRFTPTSRFGIGFLSVFAVSDRVAVKTLKPSSPNHDGPLRLTLKGPRNYLVVERDTRRFSGTRIEVLLKPDVVLRAGKLTNLVKNWCRKVEFPVDVDDFGNATVVEAEKAENLIFEVPDVTKEGANFVLRHFPMDDEGAEGDLYVLAHRRPDGTEDWTRAKWYGYSYPRKHPAADIREIPSDLVCFHGINLSGMDFKSYRLIRTNMVSRMDWRTAGMHPTLSRRVPHPGDFVGRGTPAPLLQRWQEILDRHQETSPLVQGSEGWKYVNRLADAFPLQREYWNNRPGMIPLVQAGIAHFMSFQELQAAAVVTEVIDSRYQTGLGRADQYLYGETPEPAQARLETVALGIVRNDFRYLSNAHQESFFKGRAPSNVRWIDEVHVAIDWRRCSDEMVFIYEGGGRTFFLCELPTSEVAAVRIGRPYPAEDFVLVNPSNPLGGWIIEIRDAMREDNTKIIPRRFETIVDLLDDAARIYAESSNALEPYLTAWAEIPDLPESLMPPQINFTEEMFILGSPEATKGKRRNGEGQKGKQQKGKRRKGKKQKGKGRKR